MAWRTEEGRRKWLPLVLTFLLGILIGWWVVGWWLWPVTYSNVLPQDLRPNEKGQYLMMVAESYAATRDVGLAQRRTETWPRDQLSQDLTTLQSQVALENPVAASQLRQLAAALGAASVTGPQAQVPTVRPQATTVPVQASGLLRQVCVGAVWVLVLLLGIAVLAWIWRQWQIRAGRRRAAHGQVGDLPTTRDSQANYAEPADLAEQEESHWEPVAGPLGAGTSSQDTPGAGNIASGSQAGTAPATPAQPSSANTTRAAGAAAAATRSTSAGNGDVGTSPTGVHPPLAPVVPIQEEEFLATYHAGEPDYDEAFDIKDVSGAVVGQCGLSLMMPIGRGGDQAAALQVWLWEEKDQYTQVKVLMSESAYKDEVLREQLAEENQVIPIRQGSTFDLETHRLLLRGTVEKIVLDEQEAKRVFSYLAVRFHVGQR